MSEGLDVELADWMRGAFPTSYGLAHIAEWSHGVSRDLLSSDWLRDHDAALLASRDARLAAVEALADEWESTETIWSSVPRRLRAALRSDPDEATS